MGSVQVGLFYKEIDDPLDFVTVEVSDTAAVNDLVLPDTPDCNNLPSNIFIELSQPLNADNDSKIWGAEIEYEQQFTSLPGWASGLGARVNYTYTDGTKTVTRVSPAFPDGVQLTRPLTGSPKQSGTISLTYNRNGFDALLAYTAQDRRFSGIESFGLDRYFDEFDSLDLRIEYFGELSDQEFKIFLEGNDLLRGTNEATVTQSRGGDYGVPRYNGLSATYLGGRSLVLGLSATFQ